HEELGAGAALGDQHLAGVDLHVLGPPGDQLQVLLGQGREEGNLSQMVDERIATQPSHAGNLLRLSTTPLGSDRAPTPDSSPATSDMRAEASPGARTRRLADGPGSAPSLVGGLAPPTLVGRARSSAIWLERGKAGNWRGRGLVT